MSCSQEKLEQYFHVVYLLQIVSNQGQGYNSLIDRRYEIYGIVTERNIEVLGATITEGNIYYINEFQYHESTGKSTYVTLYTETYKKSTVSTQLLL